MSNFHIKENLFSQKEALPLLAASLSSLFPQVKHALGSTLKPSPMSVYFPGCYNNTEIRDRSLGTGLRGQHAARVKM